MERRRWGTDAKSSAVSAYQWAMAKRPPLGAALALALLLPWVQKPFTLDDAVFLLEAGQALKEPSNPLALDLVWNSSLEARRISEIVPGGVLSAYALVPVALAGYSEVVAHLIQIALLVLGIAGTVRLAGRLGLSRTSAAWAGVLVSTSPAVLGIAGTVTPDILALALGVWGMERGLVAGKARVGQMGASVLAGVLFGAAALARVTMLGLPVVLVLASVLQERWRTSALQGKRFPSLKCSTCILSGAVVTYLVVTLLTRDPTSSNAPVLGAASEFLRPYRLPRHAVALSSHLMLTFGFAVVWILRRGSRFPLKGALLGLPIFAVLVVLAREPTWTLALYPGIAAYIDAVNDAWHRRDITQAWLVGWVALALPPMLYSHYPSKYLVACAPALGILAVRSTLVLAHIKPGVLLGVATLGAGLGSAILAADSRQAAFDREIVQREVSRPIRNGEAVYFSGSWAFYWYALRAGAIPLSSSSSGPPVGALVVWKVVDARSPMPSESCIDNLRTLSDDRPGGRVTSHEAQAGFFSPWFGMLPWGWADDPMEKFLVFRVNACRPGSDPVLAPSGPSVRHKPIRELRYVPW